MGDAPQPYGLESVPEEEWERIGNRLTYYFAHRGSRNPEDLAQETLRRVLSWLQDGNRIEGEDGFPKLCYGFARRVLSEDRPRQARQTDPIDTDIPGTSNRTFGLVSADSAVFVHQVLSGLSDPDREIILAAELMEPATMAKTFGTSVPNVNLRLCRARKRFREQLRSALGSRGGR